MANETMQFVLITALFGMAVVALFLTLLSLVMYLIRSTDEAIATRAGSGSRDAAGLLQGDGAPRSGTPEGASPTPGVVPPLWAIAAAAVYLDAEGESARHSASPWTARSGR